MPSLLARLVNGPRDKFPSQEAAFNTLKRQGWSPKTCIDVGAYHGDWARMFRSIFPGAAVLMVEAQEGKREMLDAAIAKAPDMLCYEIGLLGATDGQEVEFVEMETGSSVYEEASPYPRTKVKKQLATLDTMLESHHNFQQAQSLKLDTQGYELEVLKGASRLLPSVEVVLMEVSLAAINSQAPLFADVIAFMAERGFKLFDFCSQIRRKDGVLWQTDLMFLSDRAGVKIDPRLTRENWR